MRTYLALCAVALAACGCGLAPQHHGFLDDAETFYRSAAADPQVTGLAAAELRSAHDVLERAVEARATLQDAGEVDHLAYLVKQRTAIAVEAARLRAGGR